MARPIDGMKKDFDIRVRIDGKLNQELLSYCARTGTDRAKTIRLAIKEFLQKEKNPRTGK